jgi:hypothetical protein
MMRRRKDIDLNANLPYPRSSSTTLKSSIVVRRGRKKYREAKRSMKWRDSYGYIPKRDAKARGNRRSIFAWWHHS